MLKRRKSDSLLDEDNIDIHSVNELKVWKSDSGLEEWKPEEILRALMRETDINEDAARIVVKEVEKLVHKLDIDVITAPLIRELTNAKLVEYGLDRVRRQHTRIGLPFYDARRMLMDTKAPVSLGEGINREPPMGPSGNFWIPEVKQIDDLLAASIKREFALLQIYDDRQVSRHMDGSIYLNGLGHPDRYIVLSPPLIEVVRNGLKIPGLYPVCDPPEDLNDLIETVSSFAYYYLQKYALRLELNAINYIFAPFLSSVAEDDYDWVVRRLLQALVRAAYLNSGWRIPPLKVSLYWDTPETLASTSAVGPGGKVLMETYDDYSHEAKRFTEAFLRVYGRGDSLRRPLFAPSIDVVVGNAFEEDRDMREFLRLGGITFHMKGGPMDNRWSGSSLLKWNGVADIISVNLPRVAYMADGSDEVFRTVVGESMNLYRAIFEKKKEYLERIGALPENMGLYGLLGLYGLREAVKYHSGASLEDKEGRKAAVFMLSTFNDILARENENCDVTMKTTEFGNIMLDNRFAEMDMKRFPLQASTVLGEGKGYTHSHYVGIGDTATRLSLSSEIHPHIGFHPHTRVFMDDIAHWSGDTSASVILDRLGRYDGIRTIRILQTFFTCTSCGRAGLQKELNDEKCPYCGSTGVRTIRY